MQHRLEEADVGRVAIGFSSPEALAALADHLGWTGVFLADPDRILYRLLGLGRAPLWRVYSAGTLARYAIAGARGQRLPRPVDDTRQMGGDALAVDGIVVRRWRPRTPTDRVDVSVLTDAAISWPPVGE